MREDATGFSDGAPFVWDGAQREGRDDCVEALVGEVQSLRVAEAKVDDHAEILGALAGDGEHGRAELDGT